jgi:hypothetical protein
VGAPDPGLTSVSGMAAVTELVERLGVVEALDAAVGPIKQRDRGFGAGELLVGGHYVESKLIKSALSDVDDRQ